MDLCCKKPFAKHNKAVSLGDARSIIGRYKHSNNTAKSGSVFTFIPIGTKFRKLLLLLKVEAEVLSSNVNNDALDRDDRVRGRVETIKVVSSSSSSVIAPRCPRRPLLLEIPSEVDDDKDADDDDNDDDDEALGSDF